MDPARGWNPGGYPTGSAAPPPPLLGVPELDIPSLSIAAPPPLNFGAPSLNIAAPGIQIDTGGFGAAPAQQPLTEDQLQMLTMSGTIDLGQGIRVGPGGVRTQQHEAGMGAAPGVQLTQQDIDFISMSGYVTLQPGLQVGAAGMRGHPAGPGTPAPPAPGAPQGPEVENLRDLEVHQQLGAGASARVHLAQHRVTGKFYALKDMQVSLDRRALHELGTEIQISRTVESDHVVKCHNAFYEEGHMTLVLEYMDGGSVADLLAREGRIAEFYLADIARQALHGFKDLHGHRPSPIIHRDIKPSNLLVNKAGELKISDFGVSRVLEDSNDVGKTFAGTFTYMSPERIVGREYRTDSDIWAFGLSLLECAVGEYPYQPAMDYFTLLNAVKNRPPPEAPRDEFSEDFCSFISCCLQKEPDQRWSAERLLEHPFCKKYESTRLVDLLSS